MLRNAWIIPLLPALGFVLVLLFGKRLPRKGAELPDSWQYVARTGGKPFAVKREIGRAHV